MNDTDDSEAPPIYKAKYISNVPLHQEWTSCCNIPIKILEDLREKGYDIVRGRFTAKEDKRLKKNWKRFCRHFPEYADPMEAFGISYKPHRISEKQRKAGLLDLNGYNPRLRRKFKRIKLMQRMAYKLEDRLICDIYYRAKKLLAFRDFSYNSRQDVPEEFVDKIVVDLFQDKETIQEISSKMNISPMVVACIKRRPLKIAPHRWTKDDDFMLEMAIERQFDTDPYQVPTYMIKWKQIERELETCGFSVLASQAYKRWHLLNRKMVGLKNKTKQAQ